MKVTAISSLTLSSLGFLVALPFILVWWNLIDDFSEGWWFFGGFVGLLFETIAFLLAIILIVIAIIKKFRHSANLNSKKLIVLPLLLNILTFGVLLSAIIRLIAAVGGVMH